MHESAVRKSLPVTMKSEQAVRVSDEAGNSTDIAGEHAGAEDQTDGDAQTARTCARSEVFSSGGIRVKPGTAQRFRRSSVGGAVL